MDEEQFALNSRNQREWFSSVRDQPQQLVESWIRRLQQFFDKQVNVNRFTIVVSMHSVTLSTYQDAEPHAIQVLREMRVVCGQTKYVNGEFQKHIKVGNRMLFCDRY